MIDCFDGMVVSWSIGTRPNAELVNTMLDAAVEKITASGDRPVVHSGSWWPLSVAWLAIPNR
jgi:transposase InsO family protein